MGKNKKGVELPVNLIIILVIGLFVFGAAYFGFIKPSQEGSSIFGKQMDSFKDQKFSLMDNLDSLTDKEVKDLGDKSPKAMIKSTINSIENSIARGDCNVAKDIAILDSWEEFFCLNKIVMIYLHKSLVHLSHLQTLE